MAPPLHGSPSRVLLLARAAVALLLLLASLVPAGAVRLDGVAPDRGRTLEEAGGPVCADARDCASCFGRSGCGWCGATKQCMHNASAATACERGWSNEKCFASCANEPSMLHDSAGMIQVGSQAPRAAFYLPDEVCSFTIYPLPASRPPAPGGNERTSVIRLHFEYGAFDLFGHVWYVGVVGLLSCRSLQGQGRRSDSKTP